MYMHGNAVQGGKAQSPLVCRAADWCSLSFNPTFTSSLHGDLTNIVYSPSLCVTALLRLRSLHAGTLLPCVSAQCPAWEALPRDNLAATGRLLPEGISGSAFSEILDLCS